MPSILKKCLTWVAHRAASRVLPVAVGAGLTAPAFAALLGVTLSFPLISFDNQGTTTYDATTDQFFVNASPLAIRLAATDPPVIITPVPGLGETLVINATVDDTGTLTGGVPGDDLLVVGQVDLGATGFFSGVLLTGEVTGFGSQDSGGSTDFYDFTFTVTGGQLASLYPSVVGVEVTSERSDFTSDFTVSFSGEAKGTLGAVPPVVAALGDRVWEDLNANGIQDCDDSNGNGILGDVDPLDPSNPAVSDQGAECGDSSSGGAGIAGVTVNLLNPGADGVCNTGDEFVLETTVTVVDGLYLFKDLQPGDYCVGFVKLPGFDFTLPDQGGDDAVDSDADPLTGVTTTITLNAGETDRTWDAGLVRQVAALGDRVWEDLNTNGIQDCEDSNGNGIIGDVDPLAPGNPNVSDQGPECGDSSSGGAGIAGVPVNLFQPDGNGDCTIDLGRQVVTGTDGFYLFEDLPPGDYCVQFDITALPDGFCDTDGFELGAPQFTALNVGGDPAIDSDADPVTGTTDGLTLDAGETSRTLDAGIVCPAKIGDRVWEDTDQDGLQDGGELGVEGVTVRLFDCGPDGVAGTGDDVDTGQSRVTDNVDGLYMFGAEPGVFDLEPGDYYVQFDPATFPPGFDFTIPKAGGDDRVDSDCLPPDGITACTTLGSRGINLDRDCGLIPPPPPECDLDLDKKCRVETPPVSGDLECEAKIAATVLEYTGTGNPSVVTVEGKNKKAQVVSSFDPATGILTVDARPEDLGSKMTITTDGVAEVIHTSCSAPYVAGQPAPLDNPKGAPSENWFVLSFVDKNGTSVSIPGDGDGMFTDNCTFTPGPMPSCDTLKANKEKLSSLTFAYTGGGCPGDNDQGDKSSCSGSINPTEGVTVQAGEKVDNLNYPVEPMFVAPDGEFTIDPDKFKSNSVLVASNTGGTETNEFHTSCSQPLAVGDVFGSFTLVAMNGQSGSTEVTYQYVVTNNGDPLTGVLVTDNLLGPIGGPISLDTNESSEPFTKTVRISGTTVNTGTASGLLTNGEACSASDTVTVEVVEPPPTPAECKELKPIDALILEYDASQAGDRSIDEVAWYRDKFDPKDPTKNLISTTGPVTDGQVVSFDGFAEADAKNDVDFFIQFTDGGTATSRFHRSCSDEEMNDISDCGSLQGNGKDNGSGLNTWILRDLAGNGKVLGCP